MWINTFADTTSGLPVFFIHFLHLGSLSCSTGASLITTMTLWLALSTFTRILKTRISRVYSNIIGFVLRRRCCLFPIRNRTDDEERTLGLSFTVSVCPPPPLLFNTACCCFRGRRLAGREQRDGIWNLRGNSQHNVVEAAWLFRDLGPSWGFC